MLGGVERCATPNLHVIAWPIEPSTLTARCRRVRHNREVQAVGS